MAASQRAIARTCRDVAADQAQDPELARPVQRDHHQRVDDGDRGEREDDRDEDVNSQSSAGRSWSTRAASVAVADGEARSGRRAPQPRCARDRGAGRGADEHRVQERARAVPAAMARREHDVAETEPRL